MGREPNIAIKHYTDEGAMLTVCPEEWSLQLAAMTILLVDKLDGANGSESCDTSVTKDTCDCFDITMISSNSAVSHRLH